MKLAILLALIPSLALAGKPKYDKPPLPQPFSHSESNAEASSDSTSRATSESLATGGDAGAYASGGAGGNLTAAGGNATGGNSTSTSGDSTSTADNALTLNTTVERSAPSIAQGSLYIGDCGGAANGGGSNSNGAGFLGFAWTPKDCKILLAAAAFRAIGMADASCDMINALSVVKDRYKELGIKPPPCVSKPDPVPLPPADVATREYVREVVDRAFTKAVSK
jgi:hypothetical protein